MKKHQTSKSYKRINSTKSKKGSAKSKKRRGKKYNPNKFSIPLYYDRRVQFKEADPLIAPKDICLMSKTVSTLEFFNELRSPSNFSKYGGFCFIHIDLTEVKDLDYSSTCVLKAIMEDLKSKKVFSRATLPKDKMARQRMKDGGLLNSMYDSGGNPFKNSSSSDLIFVKTGSKRLAHDENVNISKTLKKVVKYLTGVEKHNKELRNVVMEICGNSLEWAQTPKKQWLIAVKYEKNRVIFTATDVGVGILKSIYRRFAVRLKETFNRLDDVEILNNAFIKKYGSTSKKSNRNKGLPVIKSAFENGLILDLKVITNEVTLDFDNQENNLKLPRSSEFGGTFYRWIVTKDSIIK